MKISLATNQFLSDDGIPLSAGRITVCLHDSDTPADLYYLAGNDYVQAPNPLICDEGGRIPTVFFEAAVVDVRVESSNGDGTYALVDTYEDGFAMNPGADGSTATGMAGLRNADTSVGTVTVVGYGSSSDCPPRNYVWDPSCTLADDGGCIISSDVDPDGRWILLYDDTFLPSSFYGISQDDDSGISAFLTYPVQAGQWNIPLPPYPRFLRGVYGAQGIFTTDRTVAFDRGARFTDAEITCRSAIVFDSDNYICDMEFTSGEAEAHSSWFRTAAAFLLCSARKLVIDSVNHFADDRVSGSFVLEDREIVAHGTLPFTFVNSGRVKFDGCSFVGTGFIPTTARVTFAHTEFREEWFSGSVNSFDFTTNILARSTGLNVLLLANFQHPEVYIKAIEADGQTSLDLAGRPVGNISTSRIRTFRNVYCNTLDVDAGTANIEFRNVHCQAVGISAWNLNVHDSVIKFATEPSLNALFCYYSEVSSQSPVTGMTMSAEFENCRVGMGFSRGSDNTTRDGSLTFRECTFYANEVISSKSISMYGCVTDDAYIRVYPYHDGNDYRISATFVGNTFVNSSPVEFTKAPQDDCYECIADWTVVDNSFTGNDDGVKCRYWSNRTGSYFDRVFIVPDGRSSIVYSGNSGKCPAGSMKGAGIAAGDTPARTVSIGSGNYLYAYSRTRRCCPDFTAAQGATANVKLYQLATQDGNTTAAIVDNASMQDMRQLSGLYCWSFSDLYNDRDGDLFLLGLCVWVTQLDSHWAVAVL